MAIFWTIVITFVITFLATVIGACVSLGYMLAASEWYRDLWTKFIEHCATIDEDED